MADSGSDMIKTPVDECHGCGFRSWELVKCRNQGGIVQYFFICDECGYRKKQYLSHKLIKLTGVDPREVQPVYPRHRCEVCGADGAQNHHWAPKALFGEEAYRWPTSHLCQSCHTRWHQLVTPNLNQVKS
ncbi:MAG: hypothetical protein V7707_18890 [Motiliproteus sp.]